MVAKGGVVNVEINPIEKRDQHCKIYVEESLKKRVDDFAMKNHMSFSEAGRKLWVIALNSFG